jgi:hypothetical protein
MISALLGTPSAAYLFYYFTETKGCQLEHSKEENTIPATVNWDPAT